jgi:FMN phosphatase YigB (HAD superfamily)
MVEGIYAVVFDLYGTLIPPPHRSMGFLFRLLKALNFKDYKHAGDVALTRDFPSVDAFVQALCPNSPLDTAPFEENIQKGIASARPYDEALLLLLELKDRGYKLGLISNLGSPFIQPVKTLGLESLFDVVLYSCKEGVKKPNEQIYQRMAERLDVPKESILMVGNSLYNDVEKPRELGWKGLHINRRLGETLGKVREYLEPQ